MGNKRIISGNKATRHQRTRYKAPLRGLYLDVLRTDGYVVRSNAEKSGNVDNIVFDIPQWGSPDPLEKVNEGVTLDIPRTWGSVNVLKLGRDLPLGHTIRDWFGGDPTGDNPSMSLHFVGVSPGVINMSYGAIGYGTQDNLYNYDWVYRYGRKFAQAPSWVAGCAQYTDPLGRKWLLVSSYIVGFVSGAGSYKEPSKFILYYTPWRYVGENPGETDNLEWVEDKEENKKWRRLELPDPGGIYASPYPMEEELGNWVFNASGTKCVSCIRFGSGYPNDTIVQAPLSTVDTVHQVVVDCVEVTHSNIGVPGFIPELTFESVLPYLPNVAGSVVQDFHFLAEKDQNEQVYNDPLTGNVDQNVVVHEEWVHDTRSLYKYGYPVAADYVGDTLRVASVEPEGGKIADGNFTDQTEAVASSTIDRDLEYTGDIIEPYWDSEAMGGQGAWACDSGYSYYEGPDQSKGRCAKVFGRAYTQTYRVGFDSDSPVSVGQNPMKNGLFWVKLYERPDGETVFADLGMIAELDQYGKTESWQLEIDYHYDSFENAFVTTKSLTPSSQMVTDCAWWVNRRRALVDPRYGVVAVSRIFNRDDEDIEMYMDGSDNPKFKHYTLDYGPSLYEIAGGEVWLMGQIIIDDSPVKEVGLTYSTFVESAGLANTPSNSAVANSRVENNSYAYMYTGDLSELGFWGATDDGDWSLTDYGLRYIGNGKHLYMFSYRYEDYSNAQTGKHPIGRARWWVNPDFQQFRAKNPDPDTQDQEPYATSADPRDVMGVYFYDSELDVEYDEPFVANMYLFL